VCAPIHVVGSELALQRGTSGHSVVQGKQGGLLRQRALDDLQSLPKVSAPVCLFYKTILNPKYIIKGTLQNSFLSRTLTERPTLSASSSPKNSFHLLDTFAMR
jgi:hypothetical protein